MAPHKGVHNPQNSQQQLLICQMEDLKYRTIICRRQLAALPRPLAGREGACYSTPRTQLRSQPLGSRYLTPHQFFSGTSLSFFLEIYLPAATLIPRDQFPFQHSPLVISLQCSQSRQNNGVISTTANNSLTNKLCAWRHNMPRQLYTGRCGPAAAHPLRLRRSARLASNSCGRHEY